MRVIRTVLAAVAIAALTILAQSLLHTGATSAETVPPPPAPAVIGIIDSSVFGDDKAGIGRVKVAMDQLDAKFQPLRSEIRGMQERLNTMRTDLQKKQGIQDAATTARQADEAERLEVQIKRKAEDARASYQKESIAMMEPLQKDISTALNAYAQARGITLVFDAQRVPILYAATSLDITKDFIADYNRTHPAGAAPATTRPATSTPPRPTRP